MPIDWADHYRRQETPWDLGRAHPELAARVADGRLGPPGPGARVLVPGCGRGHDALLMARSGWRVTALDVVPDLAALIGPRLEQHGGELVVADALEWRSPVRFHLVLDHTFFCALDPGQRPAFGALVRDQLRPRGELCSIVFPRGKGAELGGPPFGMDASDLQQSLGEGFACVENAALEQRVTRRRWAEGWARFARHTPAPQSFTS